MTTERDKVVLGLTTAYHEIDIMCRYVDECPHRYHRQLTSVFVRAGLMSASGTPCKFNQIYKKHRKGTLN